MAIAYVDAGAVARQAGDASPATVPYPATTTDQNLLLLVVPTGSVGNGAPTTPAGWQSVHTAVSTTGSFSTSAGPRRATVFWQIADGTEGGTDVTLAWDSPGGAAVLGAQIHQFSKTDDDWEVPAAASGEDTSLGSGSASFSIVTGALALDVGDLVFGAPAAAGDGFMTAPTFSAAGITLGTVTERPSGESSNGRVTWCFASAPVTAGTASGAVTMTWDLFGDATTGLAIAVRLRELAGGGTPTVVDATVGTASAAGSPAAVLAPVNVTATIGAASAAGLASAVHEQTRVNATIGGASAAGVIALIAADLIVLATVGAASATGQQASVGLDGTIDATVGGATAAGLPAAIQLAERIAAGIGAAGAAGAAATVNLTLRIETTVGSASAGGYTAEITDGPAGSGASAAQIWNYLLPNGMTAGATLVQTHTWLAELRLLHGLDPTAPLVNTLTSRSVGDIEQSIEETGDGTVTVTRLP